MNKRLERSERCAVLKAAGLQFGRNRILDAFREGVDGWEVEDRHTGESWIGREENGRWIFVNS